jgi:hypothetical protein
MIGLNESPISRRSTIARILSGRKAEKVFAIGFNKTGTTSLHRIFQDLGYRSFHGTKWRNTSKPLIYYLYDAFCDGEPEDFRELDKMFPNAKFILQVRDLSPWLDSRLEHVQRLPPNKKRTLHWSADESSVQAWVRKWNSFHTAALPYFRDRPKDFLLINYIRDPQAAEKIAAFLGRSSPVKKRHANRNPTAEAKLKNNEMITKALKNMGIPSAEWMNDIHCPSLSGVSADNIASDTSLIQERM